MVFNTTFNTISVISWRSVLSSNYSFSWAYSFYITQDTVLLLSLQLITVYLFICGMYQFDKLRDFLRNTSKRN